MREKQRKVLLKWFNRLDRFNILRLLPDKAYLKLCFKLKMNQKLDLKNPTTFSEKLQWLKLYNRNPVYTLIVDKYAFKSVVAERVGQEYLIPCIGGPWNSFDDIDFDVLPKQFVLKTNHDSGGVVLCRDKVSFDKERARTFLEKHLAKNYYWSGREWPYKKVNPCIFAEQFLDDGSGDAIYDYKFFCFDGVPKIMYLSRDKSDTPQTDFFDMEYNHLDMRMRDPNSKIIPQKPARFEEMKRIAANLSKGIPHVRVDFYMVGNRLYIGEMTFFHCGGFVDVKPEKWNRVMGDWITLPRFKSNSVFAPFPNSKRRLKL